MIPDWLTIIPDLPIRALCDLAIQLKLARNYRLGEITLADEIWDNVNVFDCIRIKEKNRVAQTRFLFPKGAFNIDKNFSAPNFGRVRQSRRARIRIHGRAVTNDQKRAIRSHRRKRSTPNAQRPTPN